MSPPHASTTRRRTRALALLAAAELLVLGAAWLFLAPPRDPTAPAVVPAPGSPTRRDEVVVGRDTAVPEPSTSDRRTTMGGALDAVDEWRPSEGEAAVRFQITFAADGRPAPFAEVQIERPQRSERISSTMGLGVATKDALDFVVAARYRADSNGIALASYAYVGARAVARLGEAFGVAAVDADGPQLLRRIELRVDEPTSVRVRTQRGVPLQGIPLALRSADDGTRITLGLTDDDGSLAITRVPLLPRRGRLFVDAPGLEQIALAWPLDQALEHALVVPALGVIEVQLVDRDGRTALVAPEVHLVHTSDVAGHRHRANAHGTIARFPCVAAGECYVASARIGGVIVAATVDLPVAGGTAVAVLTLAANVPVLRGSIDAGSGSSAGSLLRFLSSAGGDPIDASAIVATDGSFALPLQPATRGRQLRGELLLHRAGERVPLCAGLNTVVAAGDTWLGTIRLAPWPVLASGRVLAASKLADVHLRVEQGVGEADGTVRWSPLSTAIVEVAVNGQLTVCGTVDVDCLRLCADVLGQPPIEPVEFVVGDDQLLLDLTTPRLRRVRLLVDAAVANAPRLLVVESGDPDKPPWQRLELARDGEMLMAMLPRSHPHEVIVRGFGSAVALAVLAPATSDSVIDLRGIAVVTELLLQETDGSPCGDEAVVQVRDNPMAGEELALVEGRCRLIASRLNLLVSADGHRSRRVVGNAGGTLAVPLERGLVIELQLHDLPPDGARHSLRLVPCDEAGGWPSGDVEAALIVDRATLRLPLPGRYDIHLVTRDGGRTPPRLIAAAVPFHADGTHVLGAQAPR